MDEKLKYRLVGASVILALAVFFLPMILDSEKYRSQIQSQIPEIPSENHSQNSGSSLQRDQSPVFQSSGSVEKGPLVINLDEDAVPVEPIEQEVISTSKPQEPTQEPTQEQEAEGPAPQQTNQSSTVKSESVVASTPVEQQVPEQVSQINNTAKTEQKDSPDSELAFSDSAWLIQIGSFSNKDNANKLVVNLREQGYRAYQRVGDSYARVYVGPYPIKGEAEERTDDLELIVGSKVKVIEFDPKQH